MFKNIKNKKQKTKGFTLIEMIVSLGLFSVVIVVAVGALLTMVNADKQLQSEQSIMSNLSFALDSMTREIRTGINFYCDASASVSGIFSDGYDQDTIIGDDTRDCSFGRQGNYVQGISFVESGNSITGDSSSRILYFYNSDDKNIFRRVGNKSAEPLIAGDLEITDAQFFVTGSDTLVLSNNMLQPAVTIFIEARDKYDHDKVYKIETTVSQRVLDL